MIDVHSLLMEANGRATVANVELSLAEKGLTLALDVMPGPEVTVADWLASGAPGASSTFHDPADHLVAGVTARLRDGRRFEVRPSPRRAVGPDLIALCVGCGTRFATIERAWLRAHRRVSDPSDRRVSDPSDRPVSDRHEAPRPQCRLPTIDLDPPVEPGEAKLLDAIAEVLEPKRR